MSETGTRSEGHIGPSSQFGGMEMACDATMRNGSLRLAAQLLSSLAEICETPFRFSAKQEHTITVTADGNEILHAEIRYGAIIALRPPNDGGLPELSMLTRLARTAPKAGETPLDTAYRVINAYIPAFPAALAPAPPVVT